MINLKFLKSLNKGDLFRSLLLISPFLYFACIPKFIIWRGVLTPENGLFIYPFEWILVILAFIFCKKKLRPLPLVILIFGFAYSLLISLQSPIPIISLFSSLKLFLPFIIYSQLRVSSRELKYLLIFLVGYLIFTTATVFATSLKLFSYYSILQGNELISEGGITNRGFSISGGPTLSAMAIFSTFVAINLIYRNISLSLFILIITAIIGVVFTFSRGGLYSIVIAAIFIYYFNKKSKFNLSKLITLFLVCAFAYIAANFSDIYQAIRNDFTVNNDIFLDTSGRVWRYEQAFQTSYENSFIGLGGSRYYADSLEFYKKPDFLSISSPHNVYLIILVEHGLISLFCFMSVLFAPIIRMLKSGFTRQIMPVVLLFLFSFQVELIFVYRPMIYLVALILMLTFVMHQPSLLRTQRF